MTSRQPKFKKLGQNFLINQDVVADLVSAGEIDGKDNVLEVGPGLGAVTSQLVEKAGRVIAVEIDTNLVEQLRKRFQHLSNLDIVHADILDYTPPSGVFYKIVASLPYQITSPFLHRVVFDELGDISHLALIIQKEVAQKLNAKPPKASYLSNLVSLYGQVSYVQTIPPTAFDPAPKVESALITITRHPDPEPVEGEGSHGDPKRFSKFLHRGFSSPRKMLNKVFDPEVLGAADINPQRRAETLTLAEWRKLSRSCHSRESGNPG